MMAALLQIGRLSGRLYCDGKRIYLEHAAEEIVRAVTPYLDKPLVYKTQEWRGKERVTGEAVAEPGTMEHFSALVLYYLPYRAGVRVACVWPRADEDD
ncbi:MAG: hypothetical protein ACUVRC_02635 [Desulfotomaculales bacterium]